MKRWGFLLVLVSVGFAGPAFASPIQCSTNPAGCAVVQATGVYTMFSDSLENWIDLTNPFAVAVDTTVTGQFRSRGDGSLATGVLKVYDESFAAERQALGQLTTSDMFTVLGAPGSVQITVVFHAEGTAALVDLFNGGVGPGGSATIEMQGPAGYTLDGFSRGLGQMPYNGDISSDTNATPYLRITHIYNVTAGTPFNIFLRMTGVARNESVIDMFNTGVLDFTLPTGYSITSVGGYDPSLRNPTSPPGTGVVPEPSTWTLMVLGGALMARQLRRRTRHM